VLQSNPQFTSNIGLARVAIGGKPTSPHLPPSAPHLRLVRPRPCLTPVSSFVLAAVAVVVVT
jgi:hypothetical protein